VNVPALGALFLESLAFPPDAFQVEAVDAIDAGESVVVTAPTGAGKTVIALAGIARAMGLQRRSFYTTPIKALSNQKFGELIDLYGEESVGLLTGDNVINGDAPIVVMTTEVLRNMIYAGSHALDNLGVVVLDEVHYLADVERGSVWEEVVIHLDPRVQFISLSATIANAQEFTAWMRSRRGPTKLVQEHIRPVPLDVVYMINDAHRDEGLIVESVFAEGSKRPNPNIVKLLKRGRGKFRRFRTPRRREVVEELAARGLLPAIIFVFSRVGCDQAAQDVARGHLGLTDASQREHIRSRVEELTAHLSPQDLAVVGYDTWLSTLEQGVASHHAGMIPAFKETVEDLFVSGHLQVVFATETLAMGINMPARSVVIEKLSKFTGEGHDLLKPGDFTQLTGRAGRRGIDTLGTAVVLHTVHVPFDRVAAIAAAGSHPLRSSFRPSYNMVVNMIANYDRTRAEQLLQASFAQFTAQSRAESLGTRLAALQSDIATWQGLAICDRGDIRSWADTHDRAADVAHLLDEFARGLQVGDVIERPTADDESMDRWLVLAQGYGAAPRITLLDEDGAVSRIPPASLGSAIALAGELDLPEPFKPQDRRHQRQLGSLLRQWRNDGREPIRVEVPPPDDESELATCPDFDSHLDALRHLRRAEKDARRLERRVQRADTTVVDAFRAMMSLLEERGFLDGWSLLSSGERLRLVYNELDLVLAEALDQGLFDGLTGPEFAALASVFVYEPRRVDLGGGPPSPTVHERVDVLWDIVDDVQAAEGRHDLTVTRDPEVGFAELAHGWVAGAHLEDLFNEADEVVGDFVRTCRQVLDLLRQIRDGYPGLREPARAAIAGMDRGVVAAGGRV
jgi:ATP-dependent RNA helicase HelY